MRALRMADEGLRANGKFKYGSVRKATNESRGSSGFEQAIRQAGTVLDHLGQDTGYKVLSGRPSAPLWGRSVMSLSPRPGYATDLPSRSRASRS
jgi:hypothetical protein